MLACIIISWATFFSSVLSPLISPNTNYISIPYIAFLTISIALFYTSLIAIGLKINNWKKIRVTQGYLINLLILSLIIAATSRIIDRFIIRPPSNYFSIASYRESREAGSNIFSLLSAFLLPFSLILYGRIKHQINRQKKILMGLLILALMTDIVLSGSRGTLLVCLASLFSDRITKKNIPIYAALLVLASGFFFAFRFSSLIETKDIIETLKSLSQDGYATFVPASSSFLSNIGPSSAGLAYLSIIQANQYLSHGVFEFAYIFQTHPALQFNPAQLIPHLEKLYDFNSYLERENLYYTLFGTLYIAFGVFSPIACILCGVFLGQAFKRASYISGNAQGVVYLSIFLAPFVNSIGGYDMIFFLASIYIVSLFKTPSTPPKITSAAL